MLQFSIGIPVHNEEKNIECTLRLLLAQDIKPLPVELTEIVVVSDGSTDRSDAIICEVARDFPAVRLVRLDQRSGYAAAIGRILSEATGDLLAIFDADAFAEPGCLARLLEPLVYQPQVGATSGRKVPYNGWMMTTAFWELSHYFNLATPKMCGSVMAFRNVVKHVPQGYVNCDVYIQLQIEKLGLQTIYVPEAVAQTVEPETWKGFFHQRKRVYRGHLQLVRKEHLPVPSAGAGAPLRALFGAVRARPSGTLSFLLCSAFEVIVRLSAALEHIGRRPDPHIWRRTRQ